MKTVNLQEAVKESLDKLKIHPREPYNEVIKRIIEERGDEVDEN